MLYRFAQFLVRWLWPLVGRLEVVDLGNVPASGPFLLVGNHQSYLDPVLIQTVVRRPVYAMAKSTQYAGSVMRWLLQKMKSFPVRRFEVDPQAVRLVLRHLQAGDGVALYIEGERSWDGRLQPPRRGALRLMLKAGVPVIPVGISGAYDVWPRWDRRPRRGSVRIAFGEPIHLPALDHRAERDRALAAFQERLMDELARLAGSVRADSPAS